MKGRNQYSQRKGKKEAQIDRPESSGQLYGFSAQG